MKFEIKPVKTEFSNYDQMIVDIDEEPFDTSITNVSLVDSSDGSEQPINASFTSLPEGQFALTQVAIVKLFCQLWKNRG